MLTTDRAVTGAHGSGSRPRQTPINAVTAVSGTGPAPDTAWLRMRSRDALPALAPSRPAKRHDHAGPQWVPALSVANRFIGRLRHPALRETYLRWLALRNTGLFVPSQAAFSCDDLPEEAIDSALLIAALPQNRFRFLHVGRALEERLGRPLTGAIVASDAAADGDVAELLGSSLADAYQRCAERHCPFYDYVRFRLSGEAPVLFERLLLPLSAAGDAVVSHLAGVALFTVLSSAEPAGHASGEAR